MQENLHSAVATEICGTNFAAGMVDTVAPIDKGSAVVVSMHELVCQRQLCQPHVSQAESAAQISES